jgi:ABC-type dipeptide/oligopeptide/nickel transport system permease subunit
MDAIAGKFMTNSLWSPDDKQWRRRWATAASWIILLIFVVSAGFAEWIAPCDPYQNNLGESLHRPSWEHWLGTDILGRDILSRLIYGSRTALLIALIAVGAAGCAGACLGLTAGYFGRWAGAFIMRVMDGIMCFPRLALAMFISTILGGGIQGVIVAMGFSSLAIYARLMNGLVLSIKEQDYVKAAQSIGSSPLRILAAHVLPNAIPSIAVQATIQLGTIILAEAGLSFLGIGVKPPAASWGSMIADGYAHLETNPIVAFAPGMALMLVAFAFNMMGDALRDALDPRFRT